MVKVKIRTPYDKLFDEMHETYETNERLRNKLNNMLRDKNNVDMSLGIERSVSEGLRRKNETLRKAVNQARDGRTSGEARENKLILVRDALEAENKALAEKHDEIVSRLRSVSTLSNERWQRCRHAENKVQNLEAENKALANSLNYQDRLLQEAIKERDASRTQVKNLTIQLQDARLESFTAGNEQHERLAELRDDLRDLLDAL